VFKQQSLSWFPLAYEGHFVIRDGMLEQITYFPICFGLTLALDV